MADSGDITELILDDHEAFRRRFAALDRMQDSDELDRAWAELVTELEVHAAAEEAVFYPELIRRGRAPEEETRDAVGDHNQIRDAAHEATQYPVGSDAWWAAVRRARVANSTHMAEEEDDALADFRRHAEPGASEALAQRFQEFKDEHAGMHGLDASDTDPEQYLRSVEAKVLPDRSRGSLGIGSLKGR